MIIKSSVDGDKICPFICIGDLNVDGSFASVLKKQKLQYIISNVNNHRLVFHNLSLLRPIKYTFAAWNFLWNPRDTWCLFELLHASHTCLLHVFIKHRAVSDPVLPSAPCCLWCVTKRQTVMPLIDSTAFLSLFFHLQGDKAAVVSQCSWHLQ